LRINISQNPAASISITLIKEAESSSEMSAHWLHNYTSQTAVVFTISTKGNLKSHISPYSLHTGIDDKNKTENEGRKQ